MLYIFVVCRKIIDLLLILSWFHNRNNEFCI